MPVITLLLCRMRLHKKEEKLKKGVFMAEKTVYKSTGMNAFGIGANVSDVDVADGKILRTRPLR